MLTVLIKVSSSKFGSDSDIVKGLEQNGVKVDLSYGLVPLTIEGEGGDTFLVRGQADQEVIDKLTKQLGVEVFKDLMIEPVQKE